MADAVRPLDDLDLSAGLACGGWHVWRDRDGYADADDFYFIHAVRGWVVYSPVDSNGWFNYTDDAGVWHLCWGNDDPVQLQDRSHLRPARLASRQPAGQLPLGVFSGGEWRLTVELDRIWLTHPWNTERIVLFRDRPLWTWAKKPLPGCCERPSHD
jgi:hypothetical protein